jgi:hypothetical protein
VRERSYAHEGRLTPDFAGAEGVPVPLELPGKRPSRFVPSNACRSGHQHGVRFCAQSMWDMIATVVGRWQERELV